MSIAGGGLGAHAASGGAVGAAAAVLNLVAFILVTCSFFWRRLHLPFPVQAGFVITAVVCATVHDLLLHSWGWVYLDAVLVLVGAYVWRLSAAVRAAGDALAQPDPAAAARRRRWTYIAVARPRRRSWLLEIYGAGINAAGTASPSLRSARRCARHYIQVRTGLAPREIRVVLVFPRSRRAARPLNLPGRR